MTSGRITQLVSGTAIGTVLLANLFLFLPLALFLGNDKEFSMPFNTILVSYISPVVALLAVIAIVSMLLPSKLFRIFIAVVAVLSILVWAQGNLFVWNYGLLNGSSIKWEENQFFGWLELLVWSFSIAFVVWKFRQVGEVVYGIAMTLALLQTGLFGFNYLSSTEQLQQGIDLEKETAAAQEIFRYSSKDNVIHIIADGFQADILSEILNTGDAGKQLSDAMSGFTVFPKHIGAFPYTHLSVPALLSGNVYRNHMPIDEFMKTMLGDKSIISLAKKNGYEVDVAIPRGALHNIYGNVGPDNLFPVDNGGQLKHDGIIRNDAARLFDLSLFRAVPHSLKWHVYNNQKWFAQSLNKDLMPSALQNFSHMAFLRESSNQLTVDRDASVYKLFHLMLSHNPMITTSDCRPSGLVLPTNRENVLSQARCGLKEIVHFLEQLKKSGIYESSTIVVMGDHGAWVQPSNVKGVLNGASGAQEVINPAITALATPFFAIKRPGDTGPVLFNDAPSAITDTAKTIASIVGFENDFSGSSVYDLSASESRDRHFMFYQYRKSEWTDNHLAPIEEFLVTGDATDSATWNSVNTYMSNGDVKPATAKSGLWTSLSLD